MRKDKQPATKPPEKAGKKEEEKRKVDISFGSAAVPWYLVRPLILNFPSRWQTFARKAKDDLTKDDQALLSNFSGSLQNLLYFNLKLGLNIASLADLYPENESDKKKYKGFEFYPYFSVRHDWSQGDIKPLLKNRWLVGAFVGGAGIYTLLEGGQQTRPDDSVAETYLRNALILRGMGRLTQLQLSQEYSFRTEKRARFNAATEIRLVDRKTWESTVGAGIGGLLPGAGAPGALNVGGSLSVYHKHYHSHEAGTEPFRTGLTLGTSYRPEDPFNARSSRLFSLSGKLSILDLLILSVEHHRIQPGASSFGSKPDPTLPTRDTRLMLFLGPGIWQCK